MENKLVIPTSLLEAKTAKGSKFINSSEILYIQASNKHSIVYFNSQEKELETHHLLKWYEERIQPPRFLRCHASFIVNSAFIDCICGNRFVLKGSSYVPISRERKIYVLQEYKLFIQSQSVHLLQKDAGYSHETSSTLL